MSSASLKRVPLARGSDGNQLLARAKEIYLARLKRMEIFGHGMFAEYAWDMLIILYLAAVARRLPIGHLTRLAGAPMTTALRWIDYLESHKLIIRESHPTDRRSSFISLSDRGRSLLDQYLSETLNL